MLEAKLWAILYGLKLAWDARWRKVLLGLGLTLIVRLIKFAINKGHLLEKMLQSIKELTSRNWQIYISHILREGNEATDCYASSTLAKDLSFHGMSNTWLELEEIL